MSESDITSDPINLKVLQEEIPVVFELIRALGYFSKEILCPVLNELLKVANASFSSYGNDGGHTQDPIQSSTSQLACFPVLPRIRSRGDYQSDKKASGPICTKRRSKHPSLLPGIFTIFCQHG